MASFVLADDLFIEEFEDFNNWESYPHWEIQDGSAVTDRNAVLVSNNISLENYSNCTLSLDYNNGENDTRIGLYNISLDEFEYILYPENSSEWSYLEYFFEENDFLSEFAKLKIQTKFKEGIFYVDNINLSCHVSQIESEPSSSPIIRGGGFYTSSLPTINFQSATGGEVAATFSMLPYERREEFASLIPMSFFSQYCDDNRYNFCDFAVGEIQEVFVANVDNLIFYGLIIGGLYLYVKKKK